MYLILYMNTRSVSPSCCSSFDFKPCMQHKLSHMTYLYMQFNVGPEPRSLPCGNDSVSTVRSVNFIYIHQHGTCQLKVPGGLLKVHLLWTTTAVRGHASCECCWSFTNSTPTGSNRRPFLYQPASLTVWPQMPQLR